MVPSPRQHIGNLTLEICHSMNLVSHRLTFYQWKWAFLSRHSIVLLYVLGEPYRLKMQPHIMLVQVLGVCLVPQTFLLPCKYFSDKAICSLCCPGGPLYIHPDTSSRVPMHLIPRLPAPARAGGLPSSSRSFVLVSRSKYFSVKMFYILSTCNAWTCCILWIRILLRWKTAIQSGFTRGISFSRSGQRRPQTGLTFTASRRRSAAVPRLQSWG